MQTKTTKVPAPLRQVLIAAWESWWVLFPDFGASRKGRGPVVKVVKMMIAPIVSADRHGITSLTDGKKIGQKLGKSLGLFYVLRSVAADRPGRGRLKPGRHAHRPNHLDPVAANAQKEPRRAVSAIHTENRPGHVLRRFARARAPVLFLASCVVLGSARRSGRGRC